MVEVTDPSTIVGFDDDGNAIFPAPSEPDTSRLDHSKGGRRNSRASNSQASNDPAIPVDTSVSFLLHTPTEAPAPPDPFAPETHQTGEPSTSAITPASTLTNIYSQFHLTRETIEAQSDSPIPTSEEKNREKMLDIGSSEAESFALEQLTTFGGHDPKDIVGEHLASWDSAWTERKGKRQKWFGEDTEAMRSLASKLKDEGDVKLPEDPMLANKLITVVLLIDHGFFTDHVAVKNNVRRNLRSEKKKGGA